MANEDINEKERERERHSSVNKQIKTTTVELNHEWFVSVWKLVGFLLPWECSYKFVHEKVTYLEAQAIIG